VRISVPEGGVIPVSTGGEDRSLTDMTYLDGKTLPV
jgi:hypothetical protein